MNNFMKRIHDLSLTQVKNFLASYIEDGIEDLNVKIKNNEMKYGFGFVLFLFMGIPASVYGTVIRKIVPIVSDTYLKAEIHLSVKSGDQFILNGSINHSKNSEFLWKGDWGSYSFSRDADTILLVRVENLKPKLWSPVSPELYNLDVKAGNSSATVRIGFRKFEMIDGKFFLNGRSLFLRGNAINPPDRGIPETLEKSKAFARDYVRFMKSLNINIIRIPDNQNWMDVCDEEGMMIFAGRYGQPKGGTPGAPPANFDMSLKTYKEKDLGAFTAHPSVVIYILSNEMPYKGKAGDLYRHFLSQMYQELKRWDDTKLYICNAGYGLGKSADIYDVHRYWGWYYNTFLTYLNMRDTDMWQNPGKVQPITFTECVGNYTGIDGRYNLCSRTKQPNSQKCWTGHIPDAEQADAALTYQAFVLKNATEMFRRLRNQNNRLAGIMPFTILFHHWDGVTSFQEMGPKPAAMQYQTSYQPVLLSWENWQTQAYSGSTVPVIAHVVNDDDYGNTLKNARLSWFLEGDSGKLITGELDLPEVPYYETYEHLLKIQIPDHLTTGNYKLKGIIRCEDRIVSQNECELFIAGNEWKQKPALQKTIYVCDESGKTSALLSRLGYSVKQIRDLKNQPSDALLIIGENVWNETLDVQKPALVKFMKQGGRVICMKQNPEKFKTDWLPVDMDLLRSSNNSPEYLSPSFAYSDGMNVNLERPFHPVFKGLNTANFKLWSDYTNFDERKPGFPSIYPVTQGYSLKGPGLKNVAVLANYSRGLAATGLSEIFSGKGSVLFSGFDMAGRLGLDPVTDRFFRNMIDYMLQEKGHSIYVLVQDSINWGDFASEKGIVTGAYNGLMLNTTPIIPADQMKKYPLRVDEDGYQFAGSAGGWNTKPGIQYVPNGRRAVAPFSFSSGGNTIIQKGTKEGEGFFYASLLPGKKVMYTQFENVVDEPLSISISINDGQKEDYVIGPKQKLTVQSLLKHSPENIKVYFKGDRRVVILKTKFE